MDEIDRPHRRIVSVDLMIQDTLEQEELFLSFLWKTARQRVPPSDTPQVLNIFFPF